MPTHVLAAARSARAPPAYPCLLAPRSPVPHLSYHDYPSQSVPTSACTAHFATYAICSVVAAHTRLELLPPSSLLSIWFTLIDPCVLTMDGPPLSSAQPDPALLRTVHISYLAGSDELETLANEASAVLAALELKLQLLNSNAPAWKAVKSAIPNGTYPYIDTLNSRSKSIPREPTVTESKEFKALRSEMTDLKKLVSDALKGKAPVAAQPSASGTKSYAQAAASSAPAQLVVKPTTSPAHSRPPSFVVILSFRGEQPVGIE
jgi:hypothetical protein